MLHQGELGIHPAGALGVAFFVHAGAECFVGRRNDGITEVLKRSGALNLLDDGRLRSVGVNGRVFANLLEADALDRMPEMLMLCCNPNQLASFTLELTTYLENLAERGHLESIEDIHARIPILLVMPNGILSEQMLETFEEQLGESMLMRRLPGVTDAMKQALMHRVVRGISLQAGGRRGAGADTVYVLERKGMLLFAGGGDQERARAEHILQTHGYPFKHVRGVPGSRIEFDKAMISIVLNVGGLIHMVRPDGSLADLRMGDLCNDPTKADFVDRITRAVLAVGKAVGAYPAQATYEEIWATHRATILAHAGHVTSSVKFFQDALAGGLGGVKLFSNEEWILTPLARSAVNAGLVEEETLFKSLKKQVQESMARAISYRDRQTESSRAGSQSMNLVAQRNVSIDLFEAADDDVVLVGTMLDNEHLIKLEIQIHVLDEQITRSKLSMIRAPFPVCKEVEAVAEQLVGLRIERGVLVEIGRRVGGRVGCSHIKELASNIVYFAATYLARHRTGAEAMSIDFPQRPPETRFSLTKELLKDTCLAYCQTTPHALDERIGIQRLGDEHAHPLPLGEFEPSLGVLLKDRVSRWGQRAFIRHREGETEKSISFNAFAAGAFQIARHLIDDGIRPGDRVAVISENRPEMFMLDLAVMAIGAVSVPIFAGYRSREIAYVLGNARPKRAIVSGNHQLAKIEKDRHPWVQRYYCMDFDAESEAFGALDFASLTGPGGASEEALEQRIADVAPDDLCMVMYTSGTTGPPKGVCLCHRNIISQQKAIALLWKVSESDVLLSFLPWHHSFGGIFERFLSLYHGCTFCLDDSRGRDIDRMIDNWKAFDPTLFFSVPRVHDLLATRSREQADAEHIVFGGRLRFVFTAGASLPATVESVYRQHGIPVLEGWGLTETSPCVTLTTEDGSWASGYVGQPIPGVRVRIDANQEILVKGPNVMGGYLNDEEATAHVLSADGWFRTGDLGEFTDHGLRIFGRKDGAFKLTTGEKVHPQRIENILVNESQYISQAVVLGSGENYVGVLIYPDTSRLNDWAAKTGASTEGPADQRAVRELFAEELARINPRIEVKFQRIKRAVLADREPTLGAGELTPSGKIVRKAVIDRYRDKIALMFSTHPSDNVISVEQEVMQRTQTV